MGSGRNFANITQELNIRWRMIKVVVAHEAAVWITAKLTKFSFIKFFENRALVPSRARINFELAIKFFLSDVHHPDFKRGVGLGIEHKIVQSAPCAFELLKFRGVNDFIKLD